MAQWNPSWKAEVGLNHVGAYQVSGQPYASGNLDCGNAKQVEFPYVTRWLQVIKKPSPCVLGFLNWEFPGVIILLARPLHRLPQVVRECWKQRFLKCGYIARATLLPRPMLWLA
jgi:hypothetical protein